VLGYIAQSSVVVEYPRNGIYAIGLVTGDSCGGHDDEPVYNVYFPNTPNPTADSR
jgi:uncharacterized membrane protein